MKEIEKISKNQIKAIWKTARDNGFDDDTLYSIINNISGQDSMRNLNKYQANEVITTLKKGKSSKRATAGMTEGQIKKVWYLMYELEKVSPSKAKVGNRLKGIVKRQFNMDVDVKTPFIWMTYKDGSKLIEILKKYIIVKED